MKALLLTLTLICVTTAAQGQFLNFGIKGGINYNSNGDLRAIASISDIEKFSSNEETGFHIGVLSEIKLPLFMYLRPEIYYSRTESSYKSDDDRTKLTLDKIDIPVLFGFRVLKIGRIFLGPNFQYTINTGLSTIENIENLEKISSDDFSVAGQLGIGLDFGKFGADLRWETGFSETEANFIGDLVGSDDQAALNVDTQAQQFILSFYFKFK